MTRERERRRGRSDLAYVSLVLVVIAVLLAGGVFVGWLTYDPTEATEQGQPVRDGTTCGKPGMTVTVDGQKYVCR